MTAATLGGRPMTKSRERRMRRLGWRGRARRLDLFLWVALAGCSVGDQSGPGFGYTSAGAGSAGSSPSDAETGYDDDEDVGSSGAEGGDGWPGESADDGAETTGEPSVPLGNCCDAGEGPGCASPAIEACVCEHNPSCCDDMWTASCAKQVEARGCGKCPSDDGPPLPAGDCCQANGTPGCADAALEACVCAHDAECCQSEWDAACVQAVQTTGCGMCGGGNPPGGSCCAPQAGAGCGDGFVEVCVCISDPYCCFVQWDQSCVDQVTAYGCGTC